MASPDAPLVLHPDRLSPADPSDHYVTRLLHASGVPLDAPGVGTGPLPEAEAVRRQWSSHSAVFRGTPTEVVAAVVASAEKLVTS